MLDVFNDTDIHYNKTTRLLSFTAHYFHGSFILGLSWVAIIDRYPQKHQAVLID